MSKCNVAIARSINMSNKEVQDALAIIDENFTSLKERLALHADKISIRLIDKAFAEVVTGKITLDEFKEGVKNFVSRVPSGLARHISDSNKDGTIKLSFGASTNPTQEFAIKEATVKGDRLKLVVHNGVKEYTVNFNNYKESFAGKAGKANVHLSKDSSLAAAVNSYVSSSFNRSLFAENIEQEKRRAEIYDIVKQTIDLVEDSVYVVDSYESLGSFPDESKLKKLSDFTKVDEFATTKDRLLATLDSLYAIGKHKVPESVLNHYKTVLESTKDSYFRDVNLYLRNSSKESKGWFNTGTGNIMINVSKKAKNIYQTNAEVYMHELVHAFTYWGLRDRSVEARRIKRALRSAQLLAHKNTKIEDLLTVESNVATKEDWDRAKALYKYVFSGDTSLDEFVAYAVTNPRMMEHLSTIKMRNNKAKTVFEHIANAFTTLVDVLMGRYSWDNKDKNLQENVTQLAIRLGEINGKAEVEVVKANPLSLVADAVDRGLDFLDEKTAKAMHNVGKLVDTGTAPLNYPENGGPLQVGLWGLKFLARSVTNKTYRDTVLVWLSSLGLKPEGDIRQFGSDLFPEDEGKSVATWLTLKNSHIDSIRNGTAYQTINDVKNAFNRPISDLQEEALTAVMIDTDLSHMVYTKDGKKGIDNTRLIDLLSSNEKLAKAKKLVQSRIDKHLENQKARSNVVKELSMLLGIYKATGKVTPATIFNAKAIAVGHGTPQRFKVDEELIAMIKELSTIWALENVSQEHKDKVVELLKTDRKGVYAVLDIYEGFKHEAKNTLFENDELHMIDGYSKEIFESTIAMQVRKMSEREELEAAGFVYRGPVKVRASGQTEALGYFTSNMYSKADRLKGATNLGGLSARGTSIREINYAEHPGAVGKSYADRDVAVLNRKANEMVKSMMQGTFDLSKVEWGTARVTNAQGKVVDYRVMMDKEAKKELLGQDTRVSEVLGWSVASVQNKVLNKLQNESVLEAIKEGMKDWEKGTLGGDTGMVEYDLIGPNSADPEMVELYYMLPKEFRDYIQSREDKTMAVRRDLRLIMFGYKHPQISNMWGLNKLGSKWKGWINNFESLWFDLVSLAKGTILLKMPWVITTNIISNFLQVITMGVGVGEAFKLHSESIKDVKTYISHSREKIALELELKKLQSNYYRVENKESIYNESVKVKEEISNLTKQLELVMTQTAKDRIAKEIEKAKEKLQELTGDNVTSGDRIKNKIEWVKARISLLNQEMEENPVKKLVDAGLMQALVEDVNTASMNDNNRITKWIDDNMQKTPELVKEAGDILFLTSNTTWYKVMQEMLQLSDLIARDVLNRKMQMVEERRYSGLKDYQPEMVERMKEYGVNLVNGVPLKGKELDMYKEVSKRVILNTLKTRFINYTQPNGRYEEWLNKAGVLMFTKYFKRIQREILAIGSDNPVRALLGVAVTMTGLDTVQGQSFVLKGEGLDGTFGLSNLMPIHSPLDVALTVVNPPLIRLGMAAAN